MALQGRYPKISAVTPPRLPLGIAAGKRGSEPSVLRCCPPQLALEPRSPGPLTLTLNPTKRSNVVIQKSTGKLGDIVLDKDRPDLRRRVHTILDERNAEDLIEMLGVKTPIPFYGGKW